MTRPEMDIDALGVIVQTHDPDRYLTARLAPNNARASLMALYAFNAELARIPDLVTEPALGEMRLQWWRDVVDRSDRSGGTGAPVADALVAVINTYELPRHLVLGMIDARSADLDGGGFPDLQALKAYFYKSDGTLFMLSTYVVGGMDEQNGKIANKAGLAWGITNVLRSLPHDAASGRVMVPLSLLERQEVLPEQLLAGEESDRLVNLIDELADEARAARTEVRPQIDNLKNDQRSVFAPLALVEAYLAAVQAPGRSIMHEIADINPLKRFAKLWLASRWGRI